MRSTVRTDTVRNVFAWEVTNISFDFILDWRFVYSSNSFSLKFLCILATGNLIVTNERHLKLSVSVDFTTNKLSELVPDRFGKQEGLYKLISLIFVLLEITEHKSSTSVSENATVLKFFYFETSGNLYFFVLSCCKICWMWLICMIEIMMCSRHVPSSVN